ncbi:hypothetical protein D3C87_944940 [compost metagenome]
MLSAHEIAALMVLDSRGSGAGIDVTDLAELAQRRLIDLQQPQPSGRPIRLTREGYRLLGAMTRPGGERTSLASASGN